MLHSTRSAVKAAAKKTLMKAGFDVKRIRMPDPAPLYEDPLEAYYVAAQGYRVAFLCSVQKVVDLQGFRFAPPHWHPFVAATQILYTHGRGQADGLLSRYYEECQPASAAEAYLGFSDAPALYADAPPHLFRLAPWHVDTVEQALAKIQRWIRNDNLERNWDLTIESDGYPMYGPVSEVKREVELRRLADVSKSLRGRGYDRSRGDCRFTVLRRGNDIRFITGGGGYHRTAVLAAHGYDHIPGAFWPRPAIIDAADADWWPQVRRGVWTRDQALAYVDYLFDSRPSGPCGK